MPLDDKPAPTLVDIEQATTVYAAKRRALDDATRLAEAAMAAVWEKHAPGLRRLVAGVATSHDDLMTLLQASSALFTRPRSLTVDGIKVGFAKGKGAVEFDDEALVIKLIRRKLSEDQADLLIATREAVNKDALKALPAIDLARVGGRIVGTDDAPFIKPVTPATSKLLKSLLEEATE